MGEEFDKDYWESHWQQTAEHGVDQPIAPNPYLARELSELAPGTALDAGCGEGAEAIWLAGKGWQVTAADISTAALQRAAEHAAGSVAGTPVLWVEADLSEWDPGTQFDLVTTHYAHPAMPQLAFYERLSQWVAPHGTLLIVGHLHAADAAGHGHFPEHALVTVAGITDGLDAAEWDVVTADTHQRTVDRAGRTLELHDVVVRATRRG